MTKDNSDVALAPLLTPGQERLIEIAEWLESGGEHKGATAFDYGTWRAPNHCGTTCCIGGAAEHFNPAMMVDFFRDHFTDFEEPAAYILGLEDGQANHLFYNGPEDVQPERAARVIRNLVATGNVDWSIQ